MTTDELKKLVQEIVAESYRLNLAHTSERNAPVNYACVFTHSSDKYEEIINVAQQLGPVVQDTTMGLVFHISPLPTLPSILNLLKIRRSDTKRTERGDADFTITDYENFKRTYLGKSGFSIIKRPEIEMIELLDPSFNVIAYYSNPPLATVLKIK